MNTVQPTYQVYSQYPKEKPNHALSAAVERNFTAYPAPRLKDNEFYSQFKYTELKGLHYNDRDGTITRRDPSKVIKAGGKYVFFSDVFG